MTSNSNRIAAEAAQAMRSAALRVSDGLQEAKSIYSKIEDAYADEHGPAGSAFLSYFESAVVALGQICRSLDTYSRTAAPRNRRQVETAAEIAMRISYAAIAAHSLDIGGCESISSKAGALSRGFADLSPRQARKQASNFFQGLRDQTRAFERGLREFDLAADLQKRNRDRFEDVNRVIEGIGSAAEHTSRY